MKGKIILIVFLSLINTIKVFACDRKNSDTLKVISKITLDKPESIGIAPVSKTDTDNNRFEIKVIESFKENDNGKTYRGILDNYCGTAIYEKLNWLIYCNFNTDNLIEINAYGIKRSFKNPQNNTRAVKAPPPPKA